MRRLTKFITKKKPCLWQFPGVLPRYILPDWTKLDVIYLYTIPQLYLILTTSCKSNIIASMRRVRRRYWTADVRRPHARQNKSNAHLKRRKQYGAQVGAGCLAICLACNGCLETEALGGSPQGQHHLYSATGWEEIGLTRGRKREEGKISESLHWENKRDDKSSLWQRKKYMWARCFETSRSKY